MMLPRSTVRACTLADIPAVRTLLLATWHATYDGWLGAARVREIGERWHSEAQLAAQVGQPDSSFLIAEAADALAGTAFAHATGGGIEIGRLYVLPEHQGLGHGSALLRSLLAAFPCETRFHLDVEPRNARALDFYRRHGFAIIGAGPDGGGSGSGIAHLKLEMLRSAANSSR